mmetsp:Transcript_50698/g.151709  ORF Transcript_50698/g.151709 Transcript_50698/m.151709 type:complete len:494 (+) Transcript_50698:248-1729(+)
MRARLWPRVATPRLAPSRLAVRWATTHRHEASSVARPTWKDMLRSVQKLQQPTPEKFVGCLSEILNTALKANQSRDLMEDDGFSAFLKRLSARTFGFSSRDMYLVLALMLKAPGSPPSCAIVASCLEQLQEELAELDDVQLGHLGLLLAHAGEACPSGAVPPVARELWEAYGLEVLRRAPRLETKGLCWASKGMARSRQQCSAPLLEALGSTAGDRLEHLSPEQLAGLMLSMASLSYQDGGFFAEAAGQLWTMADELGPAQVSVGLLSLAMVGASEASRAGFVALARQGIQMTHYASPGEALTMLLALCAVGDFAADIVLPLVVQVCKLPRTSLSDAEDKGLHQVALSLLHEPAAAACLEAVRADPELWESCYQPEEVPGEDRVEVADDVGAATLVEALAEANSWAVARGAAVEDFYRATLLLELPRGRVAVDVDPDAQPWLPAPADIWRRLKHRHLVLWGVEVFWVKRSEWLGLDETARRRAVEDWFSSRAA